MWDIFPGTRLVRFVTVDKTIQRLLSWASEDQSLTVLMNGFMTLGPPKNASEMGKPDIMKALKNALNCLTEPSAIQQEKRTALTESASKVLNKGRIILISKLESLDEVNNIKEKWDLVLN